MSRITRRDVVSAPREASWFVGGLSGTRSLGLNLRLKNAREEEECWTGARCEHYCLTKRDRSPARGSVYEWRASAVGTRKGAFVLRSDGLRKNWDVSGPFFGAGDVPPQGFTRRSESYLRSRNGLVRQLIQRSNDGGETWSRWQPVQLRRRARHAQWYDGTPHPWSSRGVAPRTVAERPDAVLAASKTRALQSTDGVRIGANYRACANKTLVHRGSPVRRMCLHSIIVSRRTGAHLRGHFVGGRLRTDDGARVGDDQ